MERVETVDDGYSTAAFCSVGICLVFHDLFGREGRSYGSYFVAAVAH